jgi:hypothetical protein
MDWMREEGRRRGSFDGQERARLVLDVGVCMKVMMLVAVKFCCSVKGVQGRLFLRT